MSLLSDDLERAAAEEYAARCAYLTQHPRARKTTRSCATCSVLVPHETALKTHGGVFCTAECAAAWLNRARCCGRFVLKTKDHNDAA
jgi:hypothetical protein